jgi:ferredoxin-NADP reductase
MTAASLAQLIALAIFIQSMAGVWFWYRRRRAKGAEASSSARVRREPKTQIDAKQSNETRSEGFSSFYVVRRVLENRKGDIVSFYLAPSESRALPVFKPGQFLTFQFDLPVKNGTVRKVLRNYSLSDQYHPDTYRISVKREPNGLVSNFLHDQIKEGDMLKVKSPSGRFHLIDKPSQALVLIAGGIGITPMLSIIMSLLEKGSEQDIWLFYGVRNGHEVIMHDQLQSLAIAHSNFHLHLCYSQPGETDKLGIDYHYTGRVDIPFLQSKLKLDRYQFYVCGPGPMMESVVPGLESIGISPGDIHYEAFGPASLNKPNQPVQLTENKWQVAFTLTGRSYDWSDHYDTLLNLAETEGIEIESGCRAGSCGGCQSRIEKGEVEYLQEPIVDVLDGHCLLCISRPKSDLKLAV